jgi:hypothetical protein
MGNRLPHRGANGDRGSFAKQFIAGRLAGFEKDIKICLMPLVFGVV